MERCRIWALLWMVMCACIHAYSVGNGVVTCTVAGDAELASAGSRNGSHPRMLIGIGVQKSGTGFLHSMLSQHPQIVPAVRKELHVFDSATYKLTEQSHSNYLEFWKEPLAARGHPEDAVLLEITPRYIMEAAAACRIKHLFPEAKIIVALREPVSRAVSEINMKRRHCAEQKLADEDGWPYCCDAHFQPVNPKIRQALKSLKDLEDECLNTSSPDPWRRCPYNRLPFIGRGIYASQIAWWFQIFDPSQFLFINSHDLFTNPQEQLERVLRFVGVSHHWTFKVRPSNKHIVFDDPDLKELEEAMAQAYEDPNKNLYRLLATNGHKFEPFAVKHGRQHNLTMSLVEGQSLCCQQEFFKWEDVLDHAKVAHSTCRVGPNWFNKPFLSAYELLLAGSLFVPFIVILWISAHLDRHSTLASGN